MSGCGCGSNSSEGGPFSKGRDLVDFVFHAHGGAVRDQKIMRVPLATVCQECIHPRWTYEYSAGESDRFSLAW